MVARDKPVERRRRWSESAESVRYPITWQTPDVGVHGRVLAWHLDFAELRSSVGAGVWVFTPLGPVRLDYGYKLTPFGPTVVDEEPRTRRWLIYFSTGQAF